MDDMLFPRLDTLVYDARNFRDLADTPLGKDLWAFMTRADNLIRMETASILERPAVEPLSAPLIVTFGSDVRDDRTKQMIGHMARQIMEAIDFELEKTEVRITRPGLFTTAATYRPARRAGRAMKITAEQRAAWVRNTKTSAFNRWLDGQVRAEDGTLDLERLYRVAAEHGVTKRYDHLNPGQQRMNIGVQLRKAVDKAVYEPK